MKKLPNLDLLKTHFSYSPETGEFIRILASGYRNCKPAGAKLSSINSQGYPVVFFQGQRYFLHRIAFLFMTGKEPCGDIDHINGIPTDNRWCNLRDVPHQLNCQNRRKGIGSVGVLGVTQNKYSYLAKIQLNGECINLGSFKTIEEAQAAYIKKKRQIHKGNTL